MSYTAKDLYVNGLARVGLNFPDGLVGETNPRGVYTALTGGISDFYLTHEWDFLLRATEANTTVDSSEIDFGDFTLNSETVDVFYGLFIPDLGLELKVMQIRDAYSLPESTRGVPVRYIANGGSIRLLPTPGAEYTIRAVYYVQIPAPNAEAQGGDGLYTYPDTIDLSGYIPEWVRALAELYVARHIALLLKDRDAHQMVQEQIANTRRVLDDNVRKTTAPVPPQTRLDWYQ